MNHIISRVALAALITSTVAPVAQAGIWETLNREPNKGFIKYVALPLAGIMATGKAISYGYKWYKKDAFAKLAADKATAKRKTEELQKLQIELGDLLNTKAKLKPSLVDGVSSEEDRQAMGKIADAIDRQNEVPTGAHAAIDALISAKKQAIEAKRAEIPAINEPYNAADFGDNLFFIGAALSASIALGALIQSDYIYGATALGFLGYHLFTKHA